MNEEEIEEGFKVARRYNYVAIGANVTSPDGLDKDQAIEIMRTFGPFDEEYSKFVMDNEPEKDFSINLNSPQAKF